MTTQSQKLLQEAGAIQAQRGKDYDPDSQQKERSFQKTATAFNAITGRDLSSAEVCLIMALLKNVRQFSNPNRIHYDSLLDAVSYQALLGEEVINQLSVQDPIGDLVRAETIKP